MREPNHTEDVTMPERGSDPRAEKVAVVDEVRARLDAADAVLVSEYRGLDVAALAELRRALRPVGGDYKIYKNTLVRRAVQDTDVELADLLSGPTALTFVTVRPGGDAADAVDVAKALRDFARANPALLVKGGVLGDRTLSAAEAQALADVESREVLLARLAGMLAAPLSQFAALLEALPRNLAFGLAALVAQGGGGQADLETDEAAAEGSGTTQE